MNDNIEKKTLNFRAGDWDFIESIAKPQGNATSAVIRAIISNWVDARRAPDNVKTEIEL